MTACDRGLIESVIYLVYGRLNRRNLGGITRASVLQSMTEKVFLGKTRSPDIALPKNYVGYCTEMTRTAIADKNDASESNSRLVVITSRDLTPSRSWGRLIRGLDTGSQQLVGLARGKEDEVDDILATQSLVFFPRDVTHADIWEEDPHKSTLILYQSLIEDGDFTKNHGIAMSMLSRRDFSGTFRTLDREVVLRRLYLSILGRLEVSQPTHVVFDETPHEVVDFTLFFIAQWHGIKTLFFQPSLVGPQIIARTSISTILEVKPPVWPQLLLTEAEEVFNISRKVLEKLLRGEGTMLLDRQKKADTTAKSFSSRVRAKSFTLRAIFGPRRNPMVSLIGHNFGRRWVHNGLELLLSRSLRRSLQKAILSLPAAPTGGFRDYAVLALHYEPERTSMPEGLPFLSQTDAVVAIRNFLPDSVHLVVKEHYAQQASNLRGQLGRSALTYQLVASLPNVSLLGVDTISAEVIEGARYVFTMTGKIGIEAASAGIPAIYLGNPWWTDMPGAFDFHDPLLAEKLSPSAQWTTAELKTWFEEEFRSHLLIGLGGTSPEKYSARVAALPENYEDLEVQSLQSALGSFLLQG